MTQPSRAAVLGLYKGLRRQGALLMVSQPAARCMHQIGTGTTGTHESH